MKEKTSEVPHGYSHTERRLYPYKTHSLPAVFFGPYICPSSAACHEMISCTGTVGFLPRTCLTSFFFSGSPGSSCTNV